MRGTEIRLESLEDDGEFWVYRFGELVLRTDALDRPARDRVIALGQACGVQMAFMARHPEFVRGKRVVEPFSGSGPLGLLALQLGARQVACVDLNPRAMEFLRHNATVNGLPESGFETIVADLAEYEPDEPFDRLLANPPFVPTPPGIEGALHSAAGPDGNRLAELMISRLPSLLRPEGQVLFYVFQMEAAGQPLLRRVCEQVLADRAVEFTKGYQDEASLDDLARAYRELLPEHADEVDSWQRNFTEQFGPELTLDGYVVHVGPAGVDAGVTVRAYDGAKYGDSFFRTRVPGAMRGVVRENLIGR